MRLIKVIFILDPRKVFSKKPKEEKSKSSLNNIIKWVSKDDRDLYDE